MRKDRKEDSRGIRFLLVLGLVSVLSSACCPSGAWEDNFGRSYSFVTLPDNLDDPDSLFTGPFSMFGTVDTKDLGCGVWSISGEAISDLTNRYIVSFVADNPNKNPADQCCYNFLFEGERRGSGCVIIFGTYEADYGYEAGQKKCSQSGEMFLVSAQ